jgi:hypothetical protein
MYTGVVSLAAQSGVSPLPLALVAAHTVECVLKAYLSRDGNDTAARAPNIRHNLGELWELAYQQGLDVPADPPQWVACLSLVHDKPYFLRYSTGVHGVSLPDPEPMTAELGEVLTKVSQQLHAEGNMTTRDDDEHHRQD